MYVPNRGGHLNANDFFANIKKKFRVEADNQVQLLAASMKYTLNHRLSLGKGDGRYPKYGAQPAGAPTTKKSKNSYRAWRTETKPNGEVWLFNPAVDPSTEYNYPMALVTGKGWNPKTVTKSSERLIKKGNLYFSRQMPNGLNPYLIRKRQELKENIYIATGGLGA